MLALGGQIAMGDRLRKSMEALAVHVEGGAIEDCGHYVMEEQPEVVSGRLLGFLRARGVYSVMKTSLFSFLLGCAVGVLYDLCRVKSPAPPTIALLGLLGMVLGGGGYAWIKMHVH